MKEHMSPAEAASIERADARKKAQDEKNAAKAKKPAAAKKSPATKVTSAGRTAGGSKKSTPKQPRKQAADLAKTPSATPAVHVSNLPPPTTQIAHEFQDAFSALNRAIFDNVLPNCVIVVDRLKKAHGMFCPKRWDMRDGKRDHHEIRMDLTRLAKDGKGDKDVLGTLAHEMVHLAVEHAGKGPKKAYHCRNWARVMNEIGLKPHAIVKGRPVMDKETGANCSHAIVAGGPFDVVADELLATGFRFTWATITDPPKEKAGAKKPKAGAKVAHECPKCGDKAWGKASLKLVCGKDKAVMVCEDAPEEGDDNDA